MDLDNVLIDYKKPEIVDAKTLISSLNDFLLEMKGKDEEPKPYEFYQLKLNDIFQWGRAIYIKGVQMLKTTPQILDMDEIFEKKLETLGLCLFALKDLQELQITLKKDKDHLPTASARRLKVTSKYWSEFLVSYERNGVLGNLLPSNCAYYSYLKVSAVEYIERAHNELRLAKKNARKEKSAVKSSFFREMLPSAIFYGVGLFVLVELLMMIQPYLIDYPAWLTRTINLVPIIIQLFIFLTFPLKAIKNGNRYWVFFLFALIIFGSYYGHSYLISITEIPSYIHVILHLINNYGPFTCLVYNGLNNFTNILATAIAYFIYGFMLIPWVSKKKKIVEFPELNSWT